MLRSLPLLFILALPALAGSPAEAYSAAVVDLARQPVGTRPYVRQLYLGHLPPARRKIWWQVVSGHLNGTSSNRLIRRPWVVLAGPMGYQDVDGLLMKPADWQRAISIRVLTDDYGYDPKVWDLLAKVDPFFQYQQADIQGKLTNVKAVPVAPVVAVQTVWVDRGTLVEVRVSDVREGEKVFRKTGPNEWTQTTLPQQQAAKEKPAETLPQKSTRKTLPAPWLDQMQRELLEKTTQSAAPVVYADWFWWQTLIQSDRAPGPGYCDLLGFKDEKEFHKLLAFDKALFAREFARFQIEGRAAVGRSRVAGQPRRIARFDKPRGAVWITFDNFKALGNRNPLDTPDDGFQFDATEQMGHLANGILAMGLFNAKGERQDVAPQGIAHDKTATDNLARVEVGQCFRCHSNGLQQFTDWYKHQFRPPVSLEGPAYQKIKDVQRLYFESIEKELKPDIDRHALAIREATGLTLKEYSAAIAECWLEYADDEKTAVDLERAAREIGSTPEKIQAALRGLKLKVPGKPAPLQGYRVYDVWLRERKDQEAIPLTQYLEVVGELQIIMLGVKR